MTSRSAARNRSPAGTVVRHGGTIGIADQEKAAVHATVMAQHAGHFKRVVVDLMIAASARQGLKRSARKRVFV